MSSVTTTRRFATEVEAVQAGEAYKREYHPCGYGTTTTVWHDQATGQWVLSTYRYSSCD